ncbi:hypothetical protein [Streptomyces viridochromogenes]|nr:hypothetical protein [Streptomyces viridochromogenes]
MHGILVTPAALCVAAGVAMGVAGIVTGWVPPWGRRRIVRPRLWGYGSVVGSVGIGGYSSLGSFDGPASRHAGIAIAGGAVFFVGLALQLPAQRPGRTPHEPATRNAS